MHRTQLLFIVCLLSFSFADASASTSSLAQERGAKRPVSSRTNGVDVVLSRDLLWPRPNWRGFRAERVLVQAAMPPAPLIPRNAPAARSRPAVKSPIKWQGRPLPSATPPMQVRTPEKAAPVPPYQQPRPCNGRCVAGSAE
jgi:hypothetical protein